ncbi:protein odr-4 homolog [Bombus vosnesenskii]|uniref:Protein odr-4 homolog n=2 Tax=Pyrobombus TaxID=144703 RepID=A0A6J3JSW7_9HYME|nr:protein odr-4 homolog [Bombus vosnesenskii]XP_033343441.1 protein odr-4 homolog [Bombus vosnesenskii]XP_050477121.1 protein odr-4 homolog isoform X2 [Bombus huntii]
MGRTVYAEQRLHNYLTSLAKPDEYTIGLIVGQSAGQKDYIVHLAKTPPPLGKNVVEETLLSSTTKSEQNTATENHIKAVKDIPESWVADHAKHVTRMLPGGMRVLGTFIVGPEDISHNNNNVQKLKSVLTTMQKNLSCNKYLCGDNNEEHLILYLNSVTQKYTCKSIEIRNEILKPVDWKFQAKATNWHQLEALIDFDRLFLIAANKDPETLKKQLQDILKSVSDIIESSLIVIEGEVRSPDDRLELISKNKKDERNCRNNEKNNNDRSIQINLYIPCHEKNLNSDVRITPCNASIRLIGQLVSRTFVHQKANVEEANAAIKQDIIRSLASRLEMHWDSLIEEENGSPEENITLHEPPRRVLIALPESKVTLSDYLFPGEGPQEALLSLQELLDLEVQESNVQKDIEFEADPTEFYSQNKIDVKTVDLNIDSSGNYQTKIYIVSFSIAVLIVIFAIIIQKLY